MVAIINQPAPAHTYTYIAFRCNFDHNKTEFWIVGYKKVVISSKPTAASFSFGQRHKHVARFDTDGPGPSAYDITGLSIKGTACLFHILSVKIPFTQKDSEDG